MQSTLERKVTAPAAIVLRSAAARRRGRRLMLVSPHAPELPRRLTNDGWWLRESPHASRCAQSASIFQTKNKE